MAISSLAPNPCWSAARMPAVALAVASLMAGCGNRMLVVGSIYGDAGASGEAGDAASDAGVCFADPGPHCAGYIRCVSPTDYQELQLVSCHHECGPGQCYGLACDVAGPAVPCDGARPCVSDPVNGDHCEPVDAGVPDGRDGAPRLCDEADGGTPNLVWHLVTGTGGADSPWLSGVWGSCPNDVWIVGVAANGAAVAHWDGTAVSTTVAPNAPYTWPPNSVWGTGANDVWVVGGDGSLGIAHWDGTVWSTFPHDGVALNGVWGSGPGDVWTVGAANPADATAGVLLHWNGASWASAEDARATVLNSVWGFGPDDVWVVGGLALSPYQNRAVMLHWNGAGWTDMSGSISGTLAAVWGSGPADIWAGGTDGSNGLVIHWDGSGWTRMTDAPPMSVSGIWGSGPSDVWFVGGAIVHWDGCAWSQMSILPYWTKSIWGSGPADIWAVGAGGTVLHYGEP
jgi:hypothetical protein